MNGLTGHQTYAVAKETAKKLVTTIRKQRNTDEQILADLLAVGTDVPVWRGELLALMSRANGIPLNLLCEAIDVGPALVMARRRKDPELDEAVKNYLGAYFEDEASVPLRDVKAGVLQTALSSFAHGWKTDEGRSLTDEDLHKVIRTILDSLKLRVKDREILKLIGEDISDTLKRIQGGGSATPKD